MTWVFQVDPLQRLLGDVGLAAPIAAIAIVAIDIVLASVLAKSLRRSLRFSAGLAWLYLVMSGARCFAVADSDIEHVFKVVAAVAFALAVAQTMFVLVVDFSVGRNGKKPVRAMLRYAILGVTFLVATLIGLRAGGVTTFGVLASGAVAIGGVGAAVAEMVRQVGAGVLVQYERPFEIGDTIQVLPLDRRGVVVAMSWRITTLRGVDGVDVMIPNADIVTHSVLNFGHGDRAFRREVSFDAPYDVSPSRVHEAVTIALRETRHVEATPAPEVLIGDFRDSSVSYVARFWTRRADDYEHIDADVRERVWYAFRRAGIDFPPPVRALHLQAERRAHDHEDAVPERVARLTSCVLFTSLPPAAIVELAKAGREEPYGAGEVIVQAGEAGTSMHVVLSGEVLVRGPLDKRELIRLHAGDFFGEMSLVTGAPRAATVLATMPTRTLVIDEPALRALFEHHPEVADSLSDVIASRQTDLAAMVEQRPADSNRSRALKSVIMERLKGLFSFGTPP